MIRIGPFALLATVLLSLCSASAQPPAATPQAFAISGTVVERTSNRPLRDAIVNLNAVASREGQFGYRTGVDGRFTFTELQSGKYSLAAHRRGFPGQTYQQNGNYSTAIAVGPGLDTSNVVFGLRPGGSITGTIVDEENEPIRQAQALLFQRSAILGAPQIMLQGQRATDSSGQFRFPNLLPGTYFVAVHAVPWYAQHLPTQPQPQGVEQPNSGKELDVVYPLTYYPGTLDSAAASPITVSEGATSNLQIALRPVPSLHIQITGLQIRPGTGIGISALQLGLGGYRTPGNSQVSFIENRVELTGIAPGRYLVTPSPGGPGPTEQVGSGIFDLTVDQSIDLSAFSRHSVTGRIVFEGNSPPPPHPVIILSYPGSWMQSALNVDADGSLKLADYSSLLPGSYEVRLQNAPGFYLKSVEAKGATFSAGQLDIPGSGSVQLSLVAATGLTDLKGIALKDGQPFGGAMVLLLPKDSRSNFIGQDQSDSDGTFAIPGVPPGRYTLVAIDNGRDLLYRDPSVMKPYLGVGKELTAPLPSSSEVKVEVLPRSQ